MATDGRIIRAGRRAAEAAAIDPRVPGDRAAAEDAASMVAVGAEPTNLGRHSFGRMRGLDTTPESSTVAGRFGRMFRHLPAASHNPEDLRALAKTMEGEAASDDSPLDKRDPEENLTIPAGYTYLGQFIDHDITFDPVSSLDRQNDPNALTNFRTPRLDLDSLYGRGPADQPYLYQKDGVSFQLGNGADLPRAYGNDRALIGDPRNDENRIISQLHRLFLRFHNCLVALVHRSTGLTGEDLFRATQGQVRWHYQWLVIHDFLVKIAGQDVVDDILPRTVAGRAADDGNPRPEEFKAGGKSWSVLRPRLLFYQYRERPFMPVEFSVAAYRFGHSMVRPSYHVNAEQMERTEEERNAGKRQSYRIPVFSQHRTDNLNGFQKLDADGADLEIRNWNFFFEIEKVPPLPQPSYKIDTLLSGPLAHLPAPQIVPTPPVALAERNLLRGLRLGLPSGEDVARAMGIDPMTTEQWAEALKQLDNDDKDMKEEDKEEAAKRREEQKAALVPFRDNTPLWFYILQEAGFNRGERLGPVGARIVAEVIIGLISADPTSYLGVQPNWQPLEELAPETDKQTGRRLFGMRELIRFVNKGG